MPSYLFTARDSDGRDRAGVMDAESPGELAGELRRRGWIVVDVAAAGEGAVSARPGWWSRFGSAGLLPATGFDVETGLRQLAAMLDSGITLLSALATVAEQSRRRRMAGVWRDVAERVADGAGFADALAAHGRVFPGLVVRLARAGEHAGTLETVLERAADQLENQRHTRTQLASALMYPAIVTVLAVAVAGFLMVSVIPEMGNFLAQQNRKLPAITEALISVSTWLSVWLPDLGIAFGFTVLAIAALHRRPATGVRLDALVLRIPLIGGLVRTAETALFARGLGMLLESGVTLTDALRTAEGLAGNRATARRIAAARESVLAGGSLAAGLGRGGEFLPMLSRMTAVGEQTGTLSAVMDKTARFHEQQLAAAVKRLSVLVEPVVTLVVGGIVGFVYLAFFMAMYAFAGGGAAPGDAP
jgi:type IV pilus assembly protein PilC